MFVRQSTYDREVRKRIEAECDFEMAIAKYNNLVNRINRLGGEEFLNKASTSKQFDRSELNVLISLCHPDKHNGKSSANNMTSRLIELRKEL